MIKKQGMYEVISKYIARSINCSVNDLKSDGTIFIKNNKEQKNYLKILSIGEANIISASEDIFLAAKKQLEGKNRDELFESNLTYGQTIYYVPDLKNIIPLPYSKEFEFELLVGDEIRKLKGVEGFENSLAFDDNGNTPTCIALYAKKNDSVIAIAGASFVDNDLREVGIDVQKIYRGRNLATILVRNLSVEILKLGKIPFYSASVTNIASQAVAMRSGYMPLWTDSFGVGDIMI